MKADVLIVGGGPAGSSCAWRLAAEGLDVVVIDRAHFPRPKVCAGWVTPPVFESLEVDLDDYRRGARPPAAVHALHRRHRRPIGGDALRPAGQLRYSPLRAPTPIC